MLRVKTERAGWSRYQISKSSKHGISPGQRWLMFGAKQISPNTLLTILILFEFSCTSHHSVHLHLLSLKNKNKKKVQWVIAMNCHGREAQARLPLTCTSAVYTGNGFIVHKRASGSHTIHPFSFLRCDYWWEGTCLHHSAPRQIRSQKSQWGGEMSLKR